MRRTLLTVLLTLTLVDVAHAGWMTGSGAPPAFKSDTVCVNGMVFDYATFFWAPPTSSHVTLHDLDVVALGETPDLESPATLFTATGDYTIPRSSLYIDPDTIGGRIVDAAWPRQPGEFDYSGSLVLPFVRIAGVGTPVVVRWRPAPGAAYQSARYLVDSCGIDGAGNRLALQSTRQELSPYTEPGLTLIPLVRCQRCVEAALRKHFERPPWSRP